MHVGRRNEGFGFEVRQLIHGRKPRFYRVLFTVEDDSLVVLNIRHGRRLPESHVRAQETSCHLGSTCVSQERDRETGMYALEKLKVNFNMRRYCNWFAVAHRGFETIVADCFDSFLVQPIS